MRKANRLLKYRSLAIGGLVMVCMIVLAVAAPLLAPYEPNQIDLRARLRPPSWESGGNPPHILGTDSLGRDVLSRILFGGRISLLIGVLSVVGQGLVGVVIGVSAGYWGGVLGATLMRIVDMQLSIPFLILAISVSAAVGASLLNVIVVLAISGWPIFARLARASTLQLVNAPFVEAARSIGRADAGIIRQHILPNIAGSLLVAATYQMAFMILSEAALSYLGLGVPVDTATWGTMIAAGRNYVSSAWWIVAFPGVAIVVTVLGVNMMGNGLHDLLNPRMS